MNEKTISKKEFKKLIQRMQYIESLLADYEKECKLDSDEYIEYITICIKRRCESIY